MAALPTVMFVPFFLYNFHPYRSLQSFVKLTSISRIMQHLDFNGGNERQLMSRPFAFWPTLSETDGIVLQREIIR